MIGRAGRDQGRGVGYLQTHQPEHPVMKALVACDREAFYASEIDARERAGYPPFGRLASLIISAGDRPSAEGFARKLAAIAPIDERIQVLGPAEAPLAVIKGRYRFRLLVKSLRNVDLSEYLREWLAAGPEDQGQSQARGRRRSAELLVEAVRHFGHCGGASDEAIQSFFWIASRSLSSGAQARVPMAAKTVQKKPAVICDGRLFFGSRKSCHDTQRNAYRA